MRITGAVSSGRSARSRPPLSLKLYISSITDAPDFSVKSSRCSNVGVATSRYPQRSRTSCMALFALPLFSISSGRKSLVPLGL